MSRDYEAGYRDGSIHYELEHCPACKNVAGLQEALADNDKLWDLNEHMKLKDMAIIGELEEENAKLREQMERLVTLLRADCDIEVSWDGLRKFWSIELTEDGCLMRDRACKAEAENAKLRELAAGIGHLLFALDVDYCAGCPRDDINHPCPVYTVKGGECLYETDLRNLGVEVTG